MLIALDKEGYYLGFDVESKSTIEETATVIEATDDNWPIPSSLVVPKLKDGHWVEGASQTEIDQMNRTQGVVVETPKSNLELKVDEILALLKGKEG